MTAKKTLPAKQNKNALKAKEESDQVKKRQANNGLSTTLLNSITASDFSKTTLGEIDIYEAVEVMREKTAKVKAGDLSLLETALTAQAAALDTIFNSLARRANNSDTMSKLEICMRLSLKAQAQCARTIEVLAAMKNPPVVFAKQANISHGNQQVNNGSLPSNTPTHTGKIINQPNELLEANNGSETMDIRTTTATIGKDQAMATVEAVNRG